jgi:CheY-like chemotaxis protein
MTAAPEKPVSVLVVEDNRSDAELVVEGLEHGSPNVSVHVVRDGRDAIDHLRERADASPDELPDLILLDLNLPRHGGLETLTDLREDVFLRRIPVIVLTTSKSQREINSSYELGAAAVLNKPMRLAEHREMMEALNTFWLKHVRLPREGL